MRGRKRVLAFGTFDLLHAGHLYYLQEAGKLGGELTVVVARDSTVKKVKGFPPMNSERQRLSMVKALKIVDRAVLGSKGNWVKKVVALSPHAIALGYDQRVSAAQLKSQLRRKGLKVGVHRIKAFKPGKFKVTKIKEKVVKKYLVEKK